MNGTEQSPVRAGESALQWRGFQPFQLVSLYNMLRRYAAAFYGLGYTLEKLRELAEMQPSIVPGNVITLQSVFGEHLTKAREYCEMCELKISVLAITELQAKTVPLNSSLVAIALGELQTIIRHELQSVAMYLVPANRQELYTSPIPMDIEIYQAFPSASYDVIEASKCLAFERGTSCVFHLMRTMEIALKLLADELGVPHDENWNKVLNNFDTMLVKITDHLKANSAEKPDDRKEIEKFHSGASALLRNVKNAWRNDVMHIADKYTTEEALEIYTAVKGFLKFLATRLKEPTTLNLVF